MVEFLHRAGFAALSLRQRSAKACQSGAVSLRGPFFPQAVAGGAAVEYLDRVDFVARGLAARFKVPLEEVPGRVAGNQNLPLVDLRGLPEFCAAWSAHSSQASARPGCIAGQDTPRHQA